MKQSKIFNIFLSLCMLVAIERFCRWQTGGFRLSKATTSHIYPFDCPAQALSDGIVQPFYFLGSGVQFYAFVSEDGQTVMKLFKHHHMGLSTDLVKKLLPKSLAAPILQKRENRMHHLLKSAQIASEKLSEETGVYFTHLCKTDGLLGQITLHDKLGIAHKLDLDTTEFVLQKRAIPVFEHLHLLFQNQKIEEALSAMKNLLVMIENRSKKGIKNKDGKVLRNCGFLGETPVELDIGSFTFRSHSTNPKPHKKAVQKGALQLLGWVKKNYPENLEQCTKTLLYENFD